MLKNGIIFSLCLLLLSQCSEPNNNYTKPQYGFFDCIDCAYLRQIKGRYALHATDVMSQMAIALADTGNSHSGSSIVPATIYAVGWNSDYIIVRQCNPGASKQERAANNYFIVHMIPGDAIKSYSQEMKDAVLGPLDKETFDKKRKELGIEGIEFSLKFKENEPK
jgi:hypothetical protein